MHREPAGHLEAAIAALEAGDDHAALGELLTAWRALPVAALADAVDVVSIRIASAEPAAPIAGRAGAAREKRWLDAAALARPESLAALLATPWPAKWKDAHQRLLRLAKWPADPRIARALGALLEPPRYRSWGALPFWVAFWHLVFATGDERSNAHIDAIAAQPLLTSEGRNAPLDALRGVRKRVRLEHVYPAPALDDAQRALVARLGALLGAEVAARRERLESDAAWLARIWDAPDDEELVRVYGDWLAERGDPRGELIHLQHERAAGKATAATERRERALLAEHGTKWLHDLEPVVRREGRVFERGFLWACSVNTSSPMLLERAAASPAWSTVRELTFGEPRHFSPEPELIVDLLARPALRSLRAVHWVDRSSLRGLGAASAPFPFAVVSLRHGLDADDVEPVELGGPGLARVRELVVGDAEGFDLALHTWLASIPLWPQLEHAVVADGRPLAAWLPWMAQHARPELARFSVLDGKLHAPQGPQSAWRFTLERDAGGRFTRLTAHPPRSRWTFEPALAALEGLPPGALSACEVKGAESGDERLAATIARATGR